MISCMLLRLSCSRWSVFPCMDISLVAALQMFKFFFEFDFSSLFAPSQILVSRLQITVCGRFQ